MLLPTTISVVVANAIIIAMGLLAWMLSLHFFISKMKGTIFI
jgi:hypothetical protein